MLFHRHNITPIQNNTKHLEVFYSKTTYPHCTKWESHNITPIQNKKALVVC